MKLDHDTIAACATSPGRAGVAIVRVSGRLCRQIAQAVLNKTPKPRYAELLPFYDAEGQIIDRAIAIYFPAPHSLTGEDVLELQCHGSMVLVDLLLKLICRQGARLAEPGEFLRRAFLNAKLDLAQAEAIADMIDAQSETALRSASRSMQGLFSEKIHAITEQIIQLRSFIEAMIDFSDEEIDFISTQQLKDKILRIKEALTAVQKTAQTGALLREGLRVAIVGKPNAGKSSVLNQLSGQETAIVTEIAGTTRDIIRERIQIEGIPLHISDTAGLRETADRVEQEGIKRARQEMQQADRVIWVTDVREAAGERIDFPGAIEAEKILIVENKIDLMQQAAYEKKDAAGRSVIGLSAKTGDGVDLLKNNLKAFAGATETTEGVFTARRRHLTALAESLPHVEQALKLIQLPELAYELIAEELRLAQSHLNEITGQFTSDDLLGKIFSSFCIGK